jgi:hypothetical protein
MSKHATRMDGAHRDDDDHRPEPTRPSGSDAGDDRAMTVQGLDVPLWPDGAPQTGPGTAYDNCLGW